MPGNTTAQEEGCSIYAGCTAWEHPVLTVAFVNFLVMLCLPTYHVSRLQERANYSELEDCEPDGDQAQRGTRYLPRGNQLRKCFVAGCCSSIGWILQYWGLTFLYASTFLIVKTTAMLLITAARNMYLLGLRLQVHHAYGMSLVLGEKPAQQQSALVFTVFSFRANVPSGSAAGLLIVGTSNTTMNEDKRASDPTLGILLVVAGSFVRAIKDVMMEQVLQSDEQALTAIEGIGWQGLFSSFVSIVLLLCMYFIPADTDTCGKDQRPCMSDSLTAIRQLVLSPQLCGAFVAWG